MLRTIRERINTIPAGKRCFLTFIAGAVVFLAFYTATQRIYRISGWRFDIDETCYTMALYPVFLCFITCLMNEDLLPAVAACIGASLVISLPLYRCGYVSSAVKSIVLFAFHGVCFYYSRGMGWKSAFLRTLGLFPTFVEAFSNWDGRPFIFMALLLILGLICYYLLLGKKDVTKRDVIMAFTMIIPAAFILRIVSLLYLFYIFNPGYYP